MDKVRVHRVNFFQPEAKAIHCLSYDDTSCRLALSRSDFSIEIWDIKQKPFLEMIIPGHSAHSVETIAWCQSRLFSAGLHGQITEHDLVSGIPKSVVGVATGCSIWCLSVDPEQKLLAAGTENGHVVLFRVSASGFDFERKFDKQEGRILCLAWDKCGDIIVTGSIDTIRIWNVHTGHVIDRIIVGRTEKNMETIVWCLAVTSDMTIISGDSRGKTSFWDGKTGTLLSSLGTHKADVQALCLSKDENIVYTSGVDPVIMMYARPQTQSGGGKRKWMKSVQRIVHSHDVRALVLAKEFLVSGGVDTNLVFCKFPPKTVIKFSPFSQASYTSVASDASCVMLKYTNHLELWKLGETKAQPGTNGESLQLASAPKKVLQLKAKPDEGIICFAISNDKKWLAYSTLNQLRLFHLILEEDLTATVQKIHKVKNLPEDINSARCLLFTPCGNLVISTPTGKIQILKCDVEQPIMLMTFDESTDIPKGTHLLAVSKNNLLLATGSHDGNIHIYDLKSCKLFCKLPCYKFQPTALAFDLKSENLIAVYCDRKIVEYNIENQAYSDWSRQNCLTAFQDCSYYPIRGISFVPDNYNLLLLYDESAIYVVDKSKQEDSSKKRVKKSETVKIDAGEETSFRTIKRYKHLLDFCHLRGDQMVAVEIQPSNILDSLSPPLYRKKYGT